MVKNILDQANIKNCETRFIQPPQTTYAVYHDSYNAGGADNMNLFKEHDYTIELYSYEVDKDAEKRIEAILKERGIDYEKQERYWIEEEQLYQVIYEFSMLLKDTKEKI